MTASGGKHSCGTLEQAEMHDLYRFVLGGPPVSIL